MLFAFITNVLLLLSSTLAAPAASSIGINLGPTYLTSAYAKSAKDEIISISIKGNNKYRSYLADVLRTETARDGTAAHSDAAGRAIFVDALTTIKSATEENLGHSVDIGIISQPLYFNQTTSNALAEALEEIQAGAAGQVTRFTNAARLAYGMNSCKGFGMNSSNCDINEGEHSVVVVDYNAAYLEVAIGYLREDICSVRGYKRVQELGEDHVSNPSYVADVQKVLQEFRGTYFATFDFWDYGAHVRGVILSGDATENGMHEMRRSLAQAWPEQVKTRLKDSVDPMFVGAAGAIRMVQIEALRNFGPGHIQNEEMEINDEYDHDEL